LLGIGDRRRISGKKLQEAVMTHLGKFEKYLIEEFFDDYRAGALS
jgi:hypothetical protein